ncbi:ammonium transporter, Amt family [Desulfurella multipotens]|uniref:Ammonium transporter n=1 Tax=Desulfurella multipotens TaxID=79269 RepID=A0A1G6HNY9_9BACT|nr:ammonium transporter [Desulfurella multipotens]SDB95863.1 ammonium transporter, Amt family [Desulfurella multipotens]
MFIKSFYRFFGVLLFLLMPSIALAQNHPLNQANTAWMLISTALVLSMTPVGLGLFYGGMVRSKNILNTIGMSFVSLAIVSLLWIIIGYSLAFGPDIDGLIGSLKYIFLNNITINSVTQTIPTYLYCTFELSFAAVTLALISGSVIERIKFSSWIVFGSLWVLLVYAPIAHWVWGGGFLQKMGVLDFAGGLVVEANSGISALVLALIVGKRRDFKKTIMPPSSIALSIIGAGLLWIGWFGFNAGSAIASNNLASYVFLTTNIAASAGALSWMFAEWMSHKHPTMLGAASGAVAGLVGITPACGYVSVVSSLLIGIIAGIISWIGVSYVKYKFSYDDSLDVFGVHGLNGIFGILAVGLLATKSVSPKNGLLLGNFHTFFIEFLAIIIIIAYSALGTFLLAKLTSILTHGLRVSEEDEQKGLDIATHTEQGFDI